jgi:hypothetical protein
MDPRDLRPPPIILPAAPNGAFAGLPEVTKCDSAMDIGTWELLSYVVTTVGLPLAIAIFIYEQKKERANEEDEVYQLLSDNYQDFLKMALGHPDLHLFTPEETPELNDEQRERMLIIFSMLISLFERAYLLLYEPKMNVRQQRRWLSWEDYMRQWCRRGDFRALLPVLLEGEDAEFGTYIRGLATRESPTGSLLLSS